MDRWLAAIGDQPNLPERELIGQLWQGADQKPGTDDPEVSAQEGKISISCATAGASIGYRIKPAEDDGVPKPWSIYTGPFEAPRDGIIQVKAHRIGYEASKTVEFSTD